MDQTRIFEIAIAVGLELDIIYAGSSHTGVTRRILPVSIQNDIMKAKSSGEMKSFKLDLIILAGHPIDESFRHYSGIQDILLLEQKLIMDTGLLLEADRFHLVLGITDGPLFALTCNHSIWAVNGHKCGNFQSAAEIFITALRLIIRGQLSVDNL